MALDLPSWIVERIGVVSEAEDGAFIVSPDADTSEVKYSDILSSLSGSRLDRVEVIDLSDVEGWRYSEVSVAGVTVCEVLEIPETWGDARPPSAIENALFQAWRLNESFDPDGICERIPRKALLCWRQGAGVSSDAILAAAGLARRQETVPFEATLRSRTRAGIAADSMINGESASIYLRLFQRALSECQVELRFLYFYRVFERAYLSSAHSRLSAEFFSDPQAALISAQKAVTNERQSFISLVDASLEVKSWFDLLAQEVTAASASRFLVAIKKSCERDGWLSDREGWRRGCSFSYKIRCAIVHSGEKGPIFEAFDDSEAACAMLVPYLESAATSFLGIQPG